MKERINFYGFTDAFRDYFGGGYKNNFSYDGLKALYDYIEQYEEDCEQEVELDIIALCCEYTEYEDLEEYLGNYGNCHQTFKDFKEENIDLYDSEEEFKEAYQDMIMEELQDQTTVINIEDKESFIIACY